MKRRQNFPVAALRAFEAAARRGQVTAAARGTGPDAWREWARLTGEEAPPADAATRIFDHSHLTIQAALNSLGAALGPLHLVEEDIERGRLVAPFAARESGYIHAVKVPRPGRPKTTHFVEWLKAATAQLATSGQSVIPPGCRPGGSR